MIASMVPKDNMSRIRKIGFFHFVEKGSYADPVTSLKNAMNDGCEPIFDSLILLPEAFNLGDEYWTKHPCSPDPRILCKLQDFCKELNNVSFVAGVIVPDGRNPPYSSAYLIGSSLSRPVVVCHKQGGDGRDFGGSAEPHAPLYTRCESDCDPNNGILYDSVFITALICMDANEPNDDAARNQRHDIVRMKLDSSPEETNRILCIPSHMMLGSPKTDWPNCYVVLANSFPDTKGPGSFVEKGGEVLCKTYCKKNIVKLVDLV